MVMKTSINELDTLPTEDRMLRAMERIEDRAVILGREDLGITCLWASITYSQTQDERLAYRSTNPVCVTLAGIIS
jgi:hypothetical protein